jgi:hypothetical protein
MKLVSSSTTCLRDELAWLRSRYDDGAVAPAVYATIKAIEEEIGWRAHAKHTDPHINADEQAA